MQIFALSLVKTQLFIKLLDIVNQLLSLLSQKCAPKIHYYPKLEYFINFIIKFEKRQTN